MRSESYTHLTRPLRLGARRFRDFLRFRPAVAWTRLASFDGYRAHRVAATALNRRRRTVERDLVPGEEPFSVPGECWVCRRAVAFQVDFQFFPERSQEGVLIPNWREQLLCPECQLRTRMRAALHFLEEEVGLAPEDSVYVTEQTTELYRCLAARHPNVMGSEYLGQGVGFGQVTASGIRHESLTRLSFSSASFDVVVSLEVFEHVPEYRRALAECCRVLRPGGSLLFSVPFDPDRQTNLVRAMVDEQGEIRHLLPPEYHGDPLSAEGCLRFHSFGWELLDQLRAAGFAEVNAYLYWSRDFGYLGSDLILFLARKGAAAAAS